jgi:hypothetical protein
MAKTVLQNYIFEEKKTKVPAGLELSISAIPPVKYQKRFQ